MILGAYVENAAPEHAAGAEWSLQDLLSWFALRGHDCRVLARGGWRPEQVVDGVRITSRATSEQAAEHFIACDAIVTQLEATMDAQILAATYGTPLIQMIHSRRQLADLGVMPSCSALVVANSHHVAEDSIWPGSMIVVHPPVDIQRVAVAEPGACATLVNLSHNKGAVALFEAAKRNPDLPFMGVQGAYGDQVLGPDGYPGTREFPTPTGTPENLRVFAPFELIRDVFRYTRVLLALSQEESYGRVAAEAMVSGIPVISTRTPGLEECCAQAGHYVNDRASTEVDKLVRAALTDADLYADWRDSALTRSRYLQRESVKELRDLERRLVAVAANPPEMKL